MVTLPPAVLFAVNVFAMKLAVMLLSASIVIVVPVAFTSAIELVSPVQFTNACLESGVATMLTTSSASWVVDAVAGMVTEPPAELATIKLKSGSGPIGGYSMIAPFCPTAKTAEAEAPQTSLRPSLTLLTIVLHVLPS